MLCLREKTPNEIRQSAQIESKLAPYESTFDDFEELVIQFGYLSLFLVVLPSVTFIGLITSIVEVKYDKKSCKEYVYVSNFF